MNIDQLFTHFKKLFSTLTTKQLVGLGAVFVGAVAVVITSAYWISAPQYTLLVADMDAETANSVVSKLKADNVPYQLNEGGRSVSVPLERVDELRLQFASDGLPSSGRIGFEIFDRTAFGTTEFLEHVNYRRALEGELGRTIGSLAEVSSARVHIAMAKDSLFVDQDQPAKASVVLKLKANRPLAPASVRGIAGLVASSVESLRPESVVIIDDAGRQLNKSVDSADAGMTGAQVDRQQQIERDLTTKVVALLEPVVGSGRVRVNVAAHLEANVVEETEERFDPNAVVRSRQTTTDTSAAGLAAAGSGAAGARANQPPALSTASPALTAALGSAQLASSGASAFGSGPMPGRSSETTNFEVSKITRHTASPAGQLARLSVAVILDDERVSSRAADGTSQTTTRAWNEDGKKRISDIVAAAVGLDLERGDRLTVENIPFEAPAVDAPAEAPGFMTQVTDAAREHWPAALRGLGILLVAVFALFGVLRPLARRAGALLTPPQLPPAMAGGSARLPTVREMEGQIEAELDAMTANVDRRLPVLTQRVAKLAADEPEQVARIVRGWIAEGDK